MYKTNSHSYQDYIFDNYIRTNQTTKFDFFVIFFSESDDNEWPSMARPGAGPTQLLELLSKRGECFAQTTLNSRQMRTILRTHNKVRRAATPRPYTRLPSLTWSTELASRAQELADSCR